VGPTTFWEACSFLSPGRLQESSISISAMCWCSRNWEFTRRRVGYTSMYVIDLSYDDVLKLAVVGVSPCSTGRPGNEVDYFI
jgi:hypothetical protein